MQPPETISKVNLRQAGHSALAGDWLTPGRFGLVLAVLVLAGFPQVVLGLQSFVARDFGFFAYPLAYYQRECFWRGELPLWNPYNNCGVPFLAQWNTMSLYPPALIYLVFPLNWSLSFFCLLHLFFGGIGMYWLALRWTGNRLAAATAGVAFAFNGMSLNVLMWPSHIATFSWAPWVVLAVQEAWREGGRRMVVAALAGAMQMLAGGPETILLTWLFLLALWLFECLGARPIEFETMPAPTSPSRFRIALRFPLLVLLVAGLAAVQLAPFLDLAAHSQRDQSYADARWSVPLRGWANFLVPMAFGRVANMGVFFQYNQGWTSSYYLGVGTLLLALLAVWTVKQWRVWLLAVAAVAAALLSFGDQTFVYRSIRQVLPQLGLVTYPVKYMLVVSFAAPLLAAFAVARLQTLDQNRRSDRRLVIMGAALLVLLGMILIWAWRWPLLADDFHATLHNGLSRAACLLAAIILLRLLGREDRPAIKRFLPLILLVLFWLDVSTHEPPQNPTAAPWIFEPNLARAKLAMNPQPELGGSRAMLTPAAESRFMQFVMSSPKDNFLVKRQGYFADCNLLDGVPKVNGFFSLYPRECGELSSVLYGSTNASFPQLADFMSVSQATAPGQFFEWTPRDGYLPMATAGQKPVFLDDTNALLSLLRTDFAPTQVVILPLETMAFVKVTNQSPARVISQIFTPQRVDLETEGLEPALVVVGQTFFHRWQAYVDGRPAPLLRANYAFQAVETPAGRHHVRLIYEDRALYVGGCISGLIAAGCGAFWVRRSQRMPPMVG